MATLTEFKLFLQERLRAYDDSIRLETGSPADIQIVQPVLRRFEPDPLETDVMKFIKTRLNQEYPNMSVTDSSAISDTLIKPMSILLEPFIREIRSIRRNQNLLDPSILNKDEADALVSNVFVQRRGGSISKVTARLYFSNPVTISVGGSNFAYTASGRRFLPTRSQSITSSAMLFNMDGDLYFFDVDFSAEGVGESYNVAAGQIIGITNLPAAVRVTNLSKATGGTDEETSAELVGRAYSSIGERSLTTVPGIVARLFDRFLDLRILQVIGFNDAEMHRDVISGGGLGVVVLSGTDGTTREAVGYTDTHTSDFSGTVTSFTTALGPVGTDLSDYSLTVWYWDTGIERPHDFTLKRVESSTTISISDEYEGTDRLPIELENAWWSIRRRSITLSDIPGGILFPSPGSATISVEPDEVHVGGCVDFYVGGRDFEDKTLAISMYGTETPDASGLTAQTFTDDVVWLVSPPAGALDSLVAGATTLRLLSGSSVGEYRVLSVEDAVTHIILRVSPETVATESSLHYELVNSINIDLVQPEEILVSGDDLRTYAGSNIVDTSGSTVWALWGVSTDCKLRILNGDDAGDYTISLVVGTSLTLASSLGQTADPIQYEIVRPQIEAISRPLVRVKEVELLDADMKPTGDIVPYRHPVDSVSYSFQNPGRGAKAGSDTGLTDDTLGVDVDVDARKLTSSDLTINYWDLGVRPGDIVNILSSDNIEFYTVAENGVGGSAAAPALADNALLVTSDLLVTATDMLYEVGSPSYGSFRVFFEDPTTCAFTYDSTRFTTAVNGIERRFRPDPDVNDEYLPSDDVTPRVQIVDHDATITVYEDDCTTLLNKYLHDIRVGDRVEIPFAPLVGDRDHTVSIDLDGYTMLFDLGRGPITVRFSGTIGIDAIITQINTQLGQTIAQKFTEGGGNTVALVHNGELTLLNNNAAGAFDATELVMGVSPFTWNPWLSPPDWKGFDISNDSPYRELGYLYVASIDPTIELVDSDGAPFDPDYELTLPSLSHFITFSRLGRQRITATQMQNNVDALGLYWIDVECISEGYGDSWNIAADLQATVEGYDSDGWEVVTADTDLSYSVVEEVSVVMTPRVLLTGANWDPSNYEELVGRSFQIVYQTSSLVQETDTLVRDVQERVVCQSPLARALLPTFIRTNIEYRGGGTTVDVRASLVDLIQAIIPESDLEISDMVERIQSYGATYVQLPITVIGLRHGLDHRVVVQRSQDVITANRLSMMIPDDDGATAEGASWIQLTRS